MNNDHLYLLPLLPIAVVVALSLVYWYVLLYRWSSKVAIGLAVVVAVVVAMRLLPMEQWYWIPFSPIVITAALSIAYWLLILWRVIGTAIRKNFVLC